MKRFVLTSLVAAGVILGLAGLAIPQASAQDSGALLIAVLQCPDGYSGGDYAADCTEPAAGIEFYIGTPNTGNVDSTTSGGDGMATFSLEPYDLDPEGPDAVGVGEPIGDGTDYDVFCSNGDGSQLYFVMEELPFEPAGPLHGISFEFDAGADIACEWYRLSNPGGDVEPPVGGEEAEQLPQTGGGQSIGDSSNYENVLTPFAAIAVAGRLVFAGIGLSARERR